MSNVSQSARDLVAKIKAETTALPISAIEEYRETPFEFRWCWEGRPGEGDLLYQKKYTPKVIGARDAKSGRGGGTAAPKGLAGMALPCPLCSSSHSPLNPCA